jgi:hypothetical protein
MQKLPDTVKTSSKNGLGEDTSTSPVEEAQNTNAFISELVVGSIALQIKTHAVEFPTP